MCGMKTILNIAAAAPLPDTVKAGDEIEVQLAQYGRWPGRCGERTVVQVCDSTAFNRLVENFADEVLDDFEHKAETGGDTDAAAWVQSLQADPEKGLMAVSALKTKVVEAEEAALNDEAEAAADENEDKIQKRGGYPENTGWFSPGAGSREHKAKPAKRTIDPSKITPRENEAMGRAALRKISQMINSGNHTDGVIGAMYRKELGGTGRIDFLLGWKGKGKGMEHGSGFLKIYAKHPNSLSLLPTAIAYGTAGPLEKTYKSPAGDRIHTGEILEN